MEKKTRICYGSVEEIRAHNARKEGRPPMGIKRLAEVLEKIDPGGIEAHSQAEEIRQRARIRKGGWPKE